MLDIGTYNNGVGLGHDHAFHMIGEVSVFPLLHFAFLCCTRAHTYGRERTTACSLIACFSVCFRYSIRTTVTAWSLRSLLVACRCCARAH